MNTEAQVAVLPPKAYAPLAFYCEHRSRCKWQGFLMHQGLAWGEVPNEHEPWFVAHQQECGGRLIQIYDK